MMPEKLEVRLDEFIDPKESALVGRDNGEACLAKVESTCGLLNILEEENTQINFIVPNRIVTINKSFFLGMFELRICALGKEPFIEKYALPMPFNTKHGILNFHCLKNLEYPSNRLPNTFIKSSKDNSTKKIHLVETYDDLSNIFE